MGRILDALTEFFRADGWNFSQLEGRTTLIMTVNGAHGTYTFFAQAREEQEQVAVYSVYGVKASEAKRVEAMEYITRANYGLIIGNFELDLSDGEVRYKTSLDVEGETLTPGHDPPARRGERGDRRPLPAGIHAGALWQPQRRRRDS